MINLSKLSLSKRMGRLIRLFDKSRNFKLKGKSQIAPIVSILLELKFNLTSFGVKHERHSGTFEKLLFDKFSSTSFDSLRWLVYNSQLVLDLAFDNLSLWCSLFSLHSIMSTQEGVLCIDQKFAFSMGFSLTRAVSRVCWLELVFIGDFSSAGDLSGWSLTGMILLCLGVWAASSLRERKFFVCGTTGFEMARPRESNFSRHKLLTNGKWVRLL